MENNLELDQKLEEPMFEGELCNFQPINAEYFS